MVAADDPVQSAEALCAVEAEGDQLMANTRERWELIKELAESNPSLATAPAHLPTCRFCMAVSIGESWAHQSWCLWVRARKLVEESERS